MVRRIATEPKTGFTGVVFVASFAMFRPVMAISNAGATLLWPFCRCRLSRSVMVEMRGEDEGVVRKNPRANQYGRPTRSRAPHRLDPFGEENIAPRPRGSGTDDWLTSHQKSFVSLFSRSRVPLKRFTRRPPVQRFVDVIRYTTLPSVGLAGCNVGGPPLERPSTPRGDQGPRVSPYACHTYEGLSSWDPRRLDDSKAPKDEKVHLYSLKHLQAIRWIDDGHNRVD